ncbi:MAG TPA: hypothetical protein VFC84_00295 [Desulfosporosinus sp.]|nr:hypothetical protein [Desulfosporosinus sp.]
MQLAVFNAVCDVEIGDEVRIIFTGATTEIVDIRTVHYLKDQRVEFEFKLASVPGLWYTRKGFEYPVRLEREIVTPSFKWVLPKTTFEGCANCGNEVEIPGNEVSKCPKCQAEIFPCTTCYEQIDGDKVCDWDEGAGCWRFPKT